jgi:hypothetical protein
MNPILFFFILTLFRPSQLMKWQGQYERPALHTRGVVFMLYCLSETIGGGIFD